MVVDNKVIVEIKASEALPPFAARQLARCRQVEQRWFRGSAHYSRLTEARPWEQDQYGDGKQCGVAHGRSHREDRPRE